NDPFRVRIVSPRVAIKVHGKTRVEMAVNVPDGKKLDHVELFLNDTRVAELYNAPYVQTIDIPQKDGVGYIRAVAKLKDDPQPPVEDLVMINTPQFMEEVNVHLVELPTTVIRNGHPVTDLPQSAVQRLRRLALQLRRHQGTEGAGSEHRRQGHGVEVLVRAGRGVRAPRRRADLRGRHRDPLHRGRHALQARTLLLGDGRQYLLHRIRRRSQSHLRRHPERAPRSIHH